MIGMRKDLIPALNANYVNSNDQSSENIKGSVHAERILVKAKKGRELLLKYSGFTKDRRCITQPQELSTREFRQLCQTLRLDGFEALAQLIERIAKESGELTAPKAYRKFFAEVARNSPACGMVQIAGCRQTCEIIRLISNNSVDIFSSENHRLLTTLQQKAPILASFLIACPKLPRNAIPQDVQLVLSQILSTVQAQFCNQAPDSCHYPPPVGMRRLCWHNRYVWKSGIMLAF